jgi:hypothetical protein
MLCVIEYFEGQVSVSLYDNGDIEIIKNKGEKAWRYQNNFWDWLKKKISYDSEEISLVVISNMDEEFSIDKSLKLSKEHYLMKYKDIFHELNNKKGDDGKLYFYPKIDEKEFIDGVDKNSNNSRQKIIVEKGSIADYFMQKTQGYQKED